MYKDPTEKDVQVYINLVRTNYTAYCYHVHEGRWIPTRVGKYITGLVNDFINEDTGHAYDILAISVPPQHGKLIENDCPVLTDCGWKKHGDLKVGDYVYNHNGEKVRVTHVHPKQYANREVTFTNGEVIRCHENHEWVVYDRSYRKEKTIETKYMECHLDNDIVGRGHRYRFMLPITKPIIGEQKNLAVPPYVLGVWLGDGKNNSGQICACKEDIVTLDECRKYYPDGSEWVHKDTGVIYRSFKGLSIHLHEYGMCHSAVKIEKRIPEEYLTASIADRLELLAGLIDTDGYLYAPTNRYTFTTADIQLKETFIDLIRTFGWKMSVYEAQPITSTSGIKGKKPYWQICFNPTMEIPCRIERKRIHRFSKQRRIAVKEIKPIEKIEGNCITVEGGIYLVGRTMIPTHNSFAITETLPSFYLGRFPNKRVIEISYSEDFAKLFGRRNKKKIQEYGKSLFGIELSPTPNRADEFELLKSAGGMLSRGILSGVTGRPADLIIIDDPIKTAEEAASETHRNKIYNEWLHSFKTRLQDGAKIIIIMTRWHEDDLVGRLLQEEQNMTYINIPCEAEEDDPLGREVGEALCPEIGKDDDWLMDFKRSYKTKEGSMAWEAMFQGRPTAMDGNILKGQWWKFYETLPEDLPVWLMSVDATFKDKKDNDFVAIQVWAKGGTDMYLVDLVNEHLDFPGTISKIEEMRRKYQKIRQVLIEDKANGSAAIQTLRRTMHGIIPVEPIGGKVARANAVAPAVEAGNVYLPKYADFTGMFITQCNQFPNGAHDDQVDAFTQAISRMTGYTATPKSKNKRKPFAFDNIFKKEKTTIGKGEKINVI